MLPIEVQVNKIAKCKLGFFKSNAKVVEKYDGNQNKKNHQMGSVKNLPTMKTQV